METEWQDFRLTMPAALQSNANIPGLETHLVMYSHVLSGCTFGLDIQLFKPSLGLSGGYKIMSCDIIMILWYYLDKIKKKITSDAGFET